MKQIFSVLIFVTLLSSLLYGDSYSYYDLDGSLIYLNVVDTLVAVRLDPGAAGADAQTFALAHPQLKLEVSYETAPGEFVLFPLQSGYTVSQVTTILRFEDTVFMVNPVIRNEQGDLIKLDNTLVVLYKESTTQSMIDSLQQQFGLTQKEVIGDSLKFYVLEYQAKTNQNILQIASAYYNSGLCSVVAPDMASKGYFNSSDPYYSVQWQLENTGQSSGTVDADIDWEEANAYTRAKMTTPIVAVLDGGFTQSHEDLRSPWYFWPYDAVGSNAQHDTTDGDPWNECDGIEPACWHATTVLGVVKAYTDNGTGLASSEDSARVMPVRISDNSGNTSLPAYLKGLDWAGSNHGGNSAKILCITYSPAFGYNPAVEAKLASIYKAGKPIVAAAGNNFAVLYPATSRYVLAVGMSDRNDNVPGNSGSGSALDLVAPGVDVWTLDLMGTAGLNPAIPAVSCDANQNYMCHMTGTSYSAPLVTGIIAKMFMRKPGLLGPPQHQDSAEVVYDLVRKACDRSHYGVNDVRRVSDQIGWGRVNADKAVLTVAKGDPNNDDQVNISDAVYMIQFIFANGAPPRPERGTGDANCDGQINISDAVYIIQYIFAGAAAPGNCYFSY